MAASWKQAVGLLSRQTSIPCEDHTMSRLWHPPFRRVSLSSALLPVIIAVLLSVGPFAPALAQPALFERQDPAQIIRTVDQFLRRETTGLPGQVQSSVGIFDSRASLPACPALEAFLPPGARLWGNATVGVRCVAGTPWTVYVPVIVRVAGQYLVSARPLSQGQTLLAEDLLPLSGDLTQLPGGAVVDYKQAVGMTVTVTLMAGQPLRQDMLRAAPAVTQGQTVRIVATGRGFQITAEGRAVGNALEGQPTRVQTATGQIITGVARANGVVEVGF